MKEDQYTKTLNRLKSKHGRKAAIEAKCYECIADPMATGQGSWRQSVAACTSYSCPLYDYRAMPTNKHDEESEVNEDDI